MKIYAINPPFIRGFCRGVRGCGEASRGGTLYYPIWLAYATGLLEQSHDVRLVDAQALNWSLEDVINDLCYYDPDLCVIETNFSSLSNDLNIAKKMKMVSNATVCIVGPPTSQYAANILSEGVDIAARYEYDFTLKEIADNYTCIDDLKEIRGISYRVDKKIIHNENRDLSTSEELDIIPFVSAVYKEHLNIKDYFLSSSLYPVIQIFSGRGCPNHCTFCSWPVTLSGRKYRVRSTENIIDEFYYVEHNLPYVKEIFIEDDTFTINKKRVRDFCQCYLERDLKIAWSCNARANTLDLDTMKLMKKANCRLLIVGYESGSDRILKNIKKNVSIDEMKTFSAMARKARLMVHGDFIIGLPGENRYTISLTRKLINELKPEILQVLVPQPIPGTELYYWLKDKGYLITDDPNEYLDVNGYQRSVVSYPELKDNEMINEANKILKNYYLSIGYIPLAINQITRRNSLDEIKRLAHSARLFLDYSYMNR
jgi:radical SAM superfamily enzyme YgiQ (UPF0313 family)